MYGNIGKILLVGALLIAGNILYEEAFLQLETMCPYEI